MGQALRRDGSHCCNGHLYSLSLCLACLMMHCSKRLYFLPTAAHQVVDECTYTSLISYNGSAEAKEALLAAADSSSLCSVLTM